MKTVLPSIICVVFSCQLFAQKVEFSVQANSGISFFRGPGAQSLTFVNEVNQPQFGSNYTNASFGNIQAASYGFGGDVKLVTKHHLLFGVQAGYEILRNRINLLEADHTVSYVNTQMPVGGKTIFTNQYININPYLGYRVQVKNFAIDLTPGFDIAIGTSANQHGETTSTDNRMVIVDTKNAAAKSDIRYRFDVKLWYSKFGVSTGYSRGNRDFNGIVYSVPYGVSYTPRNAYADVIRFGLTYRIK